jgi:AcrR family transcriptional regulator
MAGSSPEIVRKPRADAVRNRERVLEAAKAVFSAGGSEASLEAVARQAGVGIGTLYRHFPTREALYEAVYRREVEQLGDLAEQLQNAPEPVEALRRWLRANVQFVATKKGMVAALALVAAGAIRDDISAEDVLRALIGMCYMHDQPGWQTTALRLLDVFVDGLRVLPANPVLTTRPAKKTTRRPSR